MARKMRKFSEGGSSKYDERYKRKLADIEKDYAKASKGKTGKAAEVAAAKRDQRLADAKDDLAKWTKSDRTQTRAGEKAAERNLSMTRKYGAVKSATAKDVGETARVTGPSTPDLPKKEAPKSFGSAFKSARAAGDKTFMWNGKSYTTAMKGEGGSRQSRPARATATQPKQAAKTQTAATPKVVAAATAPVAKTTAPQGSFAKLMDTPAMSRERAERARTEQRKKVAAGLAGRKTMLTDKEREEAKARAYGAASRGFAKGGTVKKPMPKEGATGSSSTVPMTPERKAFMKRMQAEEAASKKGVKPNPSKYAKGGKMADKAGRALKKKSADTMGRAMMKKAGGGKCYAKGGSVSSRADGIAKKGKTKGKIC